MRVEKQSGRKQCRNAHRQKKTHPIKKWSRNKISTEPNASIFENTQIEVGIYKTTSHIFVPIFTCTLTAACFSLQLVVNFCAYRHLMIASIRRKMFINKRQFSCSSTIQIMWYYHVYLWSLCAHSTINLIHIWLHGRDIDTINFCINLCIYFSIYGWSAMQTRNKHNAIKHHHTWQVIASRFSNKIIVILCDSFSSCATFYLLSIKYSMQWIS